MTRRMMLLVALLAVAAVRSGSAAQDVLSFTERPMLTAVQAIAVAEKKLRGDPAQYLLVGVNWAVARDFRPQFSDGARLLPVNDQPDTYSWFVTYLYKHEEWAKALEKIGKVTDFTNLTVVRVKSDGTAAAMTSFN